MKSTKRIIFENFFTLFNLLNLFLGIAVFIVGSYKNLLFLGVVIINTAISTIQELHSKKVLEKLSILAESKARVIRNSKTYEIPVSELVLNDVVELNTGNQIVADSIILEGEVQVNESFITGESEPVYKKAGDTILSGSFIDSGKCTSKIVHIGEDNYIEQLSSRAKYVKQVNSEIMKSLKRIIEFLTFAIIPIGTALFFSQLNIEGTTLQSAVVQTVAAIIGMIPEGLVLLTSTVLAVSVVRLSKSKVLVQELYCIETLARVDTLCLDKTGTLTEGIMEVKDVVPVGIEKKDFTNILANLAKFSEDENSTINAIREKFKKPKSEFVPLTKVAFSSKQKWSGINFEKQGSYIIGAPEFVFKNNENQELINKYANDYRVVVLAHSKNNFKEGKLPKNIEFLGLILILDKIRKETPTTLKYFYKQGVDIKIISGDNPLTVVKIAKQTGVKNYKKYIDMSKVKDEEIENIVSDYTIFGRVSPSQKELLILAMQKKGKTVAMTGDGVNDVLALKAADCSVAMANRK